MLKRQKFANKSLNNFLAVAGVEEDDSGASHAVLPTSVIFEMTSLGL